jgi:coenzyme PQQ precursor peptide PqqA
MLRIGRRLIYIDLGIGLNFRAQTVARRGRRVKSQEELMAWTTPSLVEICIGLEINGYLPAEF